VVDGNFSFCPSYFRELTRHGATRAIVTHNHASGNLEPSEADIEITRQLLAGAQLLSIPLLAHLILSNGTHQSEPQITSFWDDYPQGN
jgi:DNA repair protein RadC